MLDRWNFTVCSVTHSDRAIWPFVLPSGARPRISRFRAVNGQSSTTATGLGSKRCTTLPRTTSRSIVPRLTGCIDFDSTALAPASNASAIQSSFMRSVSSIR